MRDYGAENEVGIDQIPCGDGDGESERDAYYLSGDREYVDVNCDDSEGIDGFGGVIFLRGQ